MYLLYLDESGNENDPSNRYFVLAGLALFERQIHHLSERLERVQEEHFPNRPPIPFHASAIRAGRGFWRGVGEERQRPRLLRPAGQAPLRARCAEGCGLGR